MKQIGLFLLCLAISVTAFSQDRLIKTNAEEIMVKVNEITPDFIKYRRFDMPTGPDYTIERKDIHKIVFESGVEELFNPLDSSVEKEMEKEMEEEMEEEQVIPEPEMTPEADEVSEEEIYEEPAAEDERKKGFHFGIQVGVSSMTGLYYYRNATQPPLESFGYGYLGGLVIELDISRSFSLMSQIGYKTKGDRIDMSIYAESLEYPPIGGHFIHVEGEGSSKHNYHYAEISLIPVISLGSKFRMGIGGYLASAISGKEINDYTLYYYQDGISSYQETVNSTKDAEIVDFFPGDISDEKIYLKRWDYGIHALIGWRYPNIMWGFSSSIGMTEIEPDPLFSKGLKPTETKNLVVSAFFNYYIK